MSQGRRGDPTATSASSRLKVLFSCCFTASYDRNLDALPFIADEYDFVVEKLLVKRVPLGLFAIPRDIKEGNRDDFLGNEPRAAVSNTNQRYFHSGAIGNQGLSDNAKAVTYASSMNSKQNAPRGNRNSGTSQENGVCGSFPKFVECSAAKIREEELLQSLLSKFQRDATPTLKSKFVVAPVSVEYEAVNEQNHRDTLDRNKSIAFENLHKHARQDGGSSLQEIRESTKHNVRRKFLITPKPNIEAVKLSSMHNNKTSRYSTEFNTCVNAHQPRSELEASAMPRDQFVDQPLNMLGNFEDKTTLEPILEWKITIRQCEP